MRARRMTEHHWTTRGARRARLALAGIRMLAGTACLDALAGCTGANDTRTAGQQPSSSVAPPIADASIADAATKDGDASLGEDAGTALDGASSCSLPPGDAGAGVEIRQVAAAAPSAAGGVIAPGIYTLTAVEIFTGTGGRAGGTGDTLARRCVFDAVSYGCVEKEGTVSATMAIVPPSQLSGAHKEIAPSTIALTRDCPPGTAWGGQYTATATEVHLYRAASTETIREIMVKDP